MSASASGYNLVCKYCNNSRRFTKFEEFRQHQEEQHGTNVCLEDVVIEKERMDEQQNAAEGENRTKTSNDYDLRRLPRKCLIEMSQLLSKCLCIWHKPTRRNMSRRDRFHAYQLLLRKLREYEPMSKFSDARSIVRQIILGYMKEEHSHSLCHDANTEPEVDVKLQPVKSHTILEELFFLSSSNCTDHTELDLDKFCAFCNVGFYSTEALFAHMVDNHLSKKDQSNTIASPSTLNTMNNANPSTTTIATLWHNYKPKHGKQLQRLRKARQSACSIRKSSHSTACNSEFQMDFDSDHSDSCECIEVERQGPSRRQRNQKFQRKRNIKRSSNSSTKRRNNKRKIQRRRSEYITRKISRQRSRGLIGAPSRTHSLHPAYSISTVNTAATDHSCVKCSRSFKREQNLSKHMVRAHPPKECPICQINFITAEELKQHLLEQHSQEMTCPICSNASGTWQTAEHLALHFFSRRCENCQASFPDMKEYRQHRLCCQLDRLRCDQCLERFTSVQAFRMHANNVHQDFQPFKCTRCQQRFKFFAPLLRHENSNQCAAKV